MKVLYNLFFQFLRLIFRSKPDIAPESSLTSNVKRTVLVLGRTGAMQGSDGGDKRPITRCIDDLKIDRLGGCEIDSGLTEGMGKGV